MTILSSQYNLSQLLHSNFSLEEQLEIKLHRMHISHSMEFIPIPEDEEGFASSFVHLSRKAQHLFRVIEFWKHAECFPSQTLLAKMIGVSREWVNKLLKILSNLKVLIKHYRHRKTCIYLIPKKFRGLCWEKIKNLLTKTPQFTPQFTPSSRTSWRTDNSSENVKKKKGKKRPWEKAQAPPWLCHFKEFKEKHPLLGELFFQDPERWWNMAAFPEHIFQRVVDEFNILQNQNKINRPWNWFMNRLLKLTPKSDQKWSLAGKLKKNKGLYCE